MDLLTDKIADTRARTTLLSQGTVFWYRDRSKVYGGIEILLPRSCRSPLLFPLPGAVYGQSQRDGDDHQGPSELYDGG